MGFDSNYLSSHRGIIKIAQIIIGIVIVSLTCGNVFGHGSCFKEGRISYTSGLNSVTLIINIVFLILNLLELSQLSLERIYTFVGTVLFLIAAILIVWLIVVNDHRGGYITIAALVIIQFLLFLWDSKILQGEASNW
ncbi:unnamed protein product [Bursaphelenchus xylophilus]|uniref:(pine wood nematode) hypothetical protein n=1 Tax=Bursaphelenchus xylophilus TaxID=6326 RepID=A0A1I7SB38_BURXY|nr:unnamed protein product [Bursaphelenchus xylophilus]CAG9131723.1 unnamed protein product [Bursaphelenchus xylophilus]